MMSMLNQKKKNRVFRQTKNFAYERENYISHCMFFGFGERCGTIGSL